MELRCRRPKGCTCHQCISISFSVCRQADVKIVKIPVAFWKLRVLTTKPASLNIDFSKIFNSLVLTLKWQNIQKQTLNLFSKASDRMWVCSWVVREKYTRAFQTILFDIFLENLRNVPMLKFLIF